MHLTFRDAVLVHPIFKFGVSVLLKDQDSLNVFWSIVFKPQAKVLTKLSPEEKDQYKRRLLGELYKI